MTIPEFKRIARLLKTVYKEIETQVVSEGIDSFSPEYKQLIDTTREALLKKNGFTLDEYIAIKNQLEGERKTKRKQSVQATVAEMLNQIHTPTTEEITSIAHDVAKQYVVPPVVTHNVTNQILKETTIEKPTIVKETTVQTVNVPFNEQPLQEKLGALSKRVDEIKIQEPFDPTALKEELRNDFGDNFERNINMYDMPNFRKLAMGLREDIDALRAGAASVAIGGTITGGTTGSVLFVNPTNVIAQDPTNFNFKASTNTLTLAGANAARLKLLANASQTASLIQAFASNGTTNLLDFNPYKTGDINTSLFTITSGVNFSTPLAPYMLGSLFTVKNSDGTKLIDIYKATGASSDIHFYLSDTSGNYFEFNYGGGVMSFIKDGTNIFRVAGTNIINFENKASIGDFDQNGNGILTISYAGAKPLIRGQYDTSNYFNLSVESTGAVSFTGTGSGSQFTFDKNVGIGTASPGTKLEIATGAVQGGINVFGSNNPVIQVGANSANNFQLYWYSGAGYFGTYNNIADMYFSGKNIYFAPGNNQTMMLQASTQRVGIGTVAPSAFLHVLGTTEQQRIGYDTSNYYKTTVGSTGLTTFDAVGSGASFSFSDDVSINGNLTLGTAGNKISITEGSNASVGQATLSGGTVTVSTTAVTANSRIFLTDAGGTITNLGTLYVGTITAGTSFVINSSNILDASLVNWLIIN